MKNLIKISAFVGLFLMISFTGFSQGKTCAMKFRPAPTSLPPYTGTYTLIDVTNFPPFIQQITPVTVYDNVDNLVTFSSTVPSSSSPIYKYYVQVWDSNGHSGAAWSYSFNAPTYYNNTVNTDIINLQ